MINNKKALTNATIIVILGLILAFVALWIFFAQADTFLSILKGK